MFKKQIDDRFDKWVFSLGVLLGAILIIVSKSFLKNPLHIMAIPLTILVLYTLYIQMTQRYAAGIDRAGDSIYYMGLLFTLVSLSHALWQVGSSSSSTNLISTSLIANFGIALSSTIAGIFLRIFIQQFRNDLVDVETSARIELGEVMQKLRVSLYEMNNDVDKYRLAVLQSIEDSRKNADEQMEDSVKTSSEAFSTITKSLESSTERISDLLQGQAIDYREAIKNLSKTTSALLKTVGKIDAGASDMSTQLSLVSKSTESVLSTIRDKVAAEVAATHKIEGVIQSLDKSTSNELSEVMINIVGTMKDLSLKVEEIEQRLGQHLEKILEKSEEIEVDTNKTRTALLEAAQALRAEMKSQ